MEINDKIIVRVMVYDPPPIRRAHVIQLKAVHYWSSEEFECFTVQGRKALQFELNKTTNIWKVLNATDEELTTINKENSVTLGIQLYLGGYLTDKKANTYKYRSGYYRRQYFDTRLN